MKKFFICFLFIFLLTSCNNYNELNNVMIIDGIGIDKIKDEFVVDFNSYLSNDKYESHTVTSKNLNDVFNDLYLEVNKKVYLSHLNVLALSSNLTNNDIIEIINTFNKQNDLRGSFNVLLVNKYSSQLFKQTSEQIIELLTNNYYELGNIYPTTFNDIINDYSQIKISYLPIINNNDSKIMGMHSIIDEFRHYNLDESIILNLLLGKIKSFSFNIDDSSIKVIDTDINYHIESNNIDVDLKIKYQSNLRQTTIESYLQDNIENFLNLDINHNYFNYLIKQKDYNYYKNNSNSNPNFTINITLIKDNSYNMKDGDIIEKN